MLKITHVLYLSSQHTQCMAWHGAIHFVLRGKTMQNDDMRNNVQLRKRYPE